MKQLEVGLLDLFTAYKNFQFRNVVNKSKRAGLVLLWKSFFSTAILHSRASTNSHGQIGLALDDIYVIEDFFIVTLKCSNINLSRVWILWSSLETYAQKTPPVTYQVAAGILRKIFAIAMSKKYTQKSPKREINWKFCWIKNTDLIRHSLISDDMRQFCLFIHFCPILPISFPFLTQFVCLQNIKHIRMNLSPTKSSVEVQQKIHQSVSAINCSIKSKRQADRILIEMLMNHSRSGKNYVCWCTH